MENRRNFYRILHVQPDAPDEIIQASYRTLMSKLRRHPDLGGDHRTATLINEAYAVLGDPARRAAYDGTRGSPARDRREPARPPDPATPASPTCPFCGAAHRFGGRIHATATCTTCNSPLAPPHRDPASDSHQRAGARVLRRLSLVWFAGWPGQGPWPGETRDLSGHGLRFVANAPIPVGRVIRVELEGLVALARIVACGENDERDWRWLVRAEFVTVRFRRPRS